MVEFVPVNKLEELLAAAATDPGKRPAFYRELLDSDLLVIGTTSMGGTGSFVAGENTTLSLQQWQTSDGEPVIPVFSSVQRVGEAIDKNESTVQLNAKTLFEMIGSDTPVVLNPRSTYGKEFTPEEIKSMLDGSIFAQMQRTVVTAEQHVLLGQPAEYPHKLVEALKSFFWEHKVVTYAYLAQIFNPATGESPHPIIGVRMEGGDYDQIVQEVVIVVRDVLEEGQLVDFIQIGGSNDPAGVLRYMEESVEPFYVRGL